jgi:O-methyltransferase
VIGSFFNPWWIAADLLLGDAGRLYGIGFWKKAELLLQTRRNARHPESASAWFEHIWLVKEVLRIPPAMTGVVGEFGCFRGMCTASLSLACALIGRRLLVFDSFEGLPTEPKEVYDMGLSKTIKYKEGEYCGPLEKVRSNVSGCGRISVCDFVKGFFADTLRTRDTRERFAMIFEDADLLSSVQDVLKYAWPKLQPGGVYLCHEARAKEIVGLFFDQAWWDREIGEPAPGFIGSGVGVMTGPTTNWCCLGYTVRPA